jgi:predicted O-methyltransferase YrrM
MGLGIRTALVKAAAKGRLRISGETRLHRALSPGPFPLAQEIERGRASQLADNSPLIVGPVGSGLYDEGKTVADACRASIEPDWALILHSLVAEYRPRTILELGTNTGISSAYLAAEGARVITLEASPNRIRVARQLHQSLGIQSVEYVEGLFTDTLQPTLDRLPPIDLTFIDGHHQFQPTLDYFQAIRAHAAPDCVYIFDDIRWSAGMKRAWRELQKHLDPAVNLHRIGIGFIGGAPEPG